MIINLIIKLNKMVHRVTALVPVLCANELAALARYSDMYMWDGMWSQAASVRHVIARLYM